jgi:hypothetical protein
VRTISSGAVLCLGPGLDNLPLRDKSEERRVCLEGEFDDFMKFWGSAAPSGILSNLYKHVRAVAVRMDGMGNGHGCGL